MTINEEEQNDFSHPLFNQQNNQQIFKNIGKNYKGKPLQHRRIAGDSFLNVMTFLAVLGKSLDVYTTYYGLSNGFTESNPSVRALIVTFGLRDALIINGFISSLGILFIFAAGHFIVKVRPIMKVLVAALFAIAFYSVYSNLTVLGLL